MPRQRSPKLIYRNPAELWADHPDIGFDLLYSEADHGDLLAIYKYGNAHPMEHCQLLKKHQKCNRPHLVGWIGVTKSGSKGLIGRMCAKNHFHADESGDEFRRQAAELEREVRIETAQSTLKSLRDKWTREKIHSLTEQLGVLNDEVDKIENCLPDDIKANLADRNKTGRTQVAVEFWISEKDENGKTVTRRHAQNFGSISGLRAVNKFPSRSDLWKLETALVACVMPPGQSQNLNELKESARSLSELDELPQRIMGTEHQLRLFTTPSNIELLSVLTRNPETKLKLFKAFA